MSSMVSMAGGASGQPPSRLATAGQKSQTSPLPSPSASAWSGLASNGQLSVVLVIAVAVDVVAGSGRRVAGVADAVAVAVGLAPSSMGRMGLKTLGQLSVASAMPSPSLSVALCVAGELAGRARHAAGLVVGHAAEEGRVGAGRVVAIGWS